MVLWALRHALACLFPGFKGGRDESCRAVCSTIRQTHPSASEAEKEKRAALEGPGDGKAKQSVRFSFDEKRKLVECE